MLKSTQDLMFSRPSHTVWSTQDIPNPYATILGVWYPIYYGISSHVISRPSHVLWSMQTYRIRTSPYSSCSFRPSFVIPKVFHSRTCHSANLATFIRHIGAWCTTYYRPDIPNSYVTILLMFLQTILRQSRRFSALERAIPWTDLAAFILHNTRFVVRARIHMSPYSSCSFRPSFVNPKGLSA